MFSGEANLQEKQRRRVKSGSDSIDLRKGGTMGEPNNVLNVYMNRPDRMLSVLEYYLEEKLPEDWRIEEEEADMCKALNEIEKHAEKRGRKQGISQGENRLASLINKLAADGRTEDIKLAAADEAIRKRFYREYGIA